jgi:DNA-binding NarL/FixJ family response regulator
MMTKKLMIVDDRALARHLVRQVAAMPQDTVLECISAEEALKAMGIFKPDCVMMGVSRPVAGAFEAIKSIRETYPQVRVVAVSSTHEHRLQQLASEAGAAGYVTTENLSELFLLAAPERLTLRPARATKSAKRGGKQIKKAGSERLIS